MSGHCPLPEIVVSIKSPETALIEIDVETFSRHIKSSGPRDTFQKKKRERRSVTNSATGLTTVYKSERERESEAPITDTFS